MATSLEEMKLFLRSTTRSIFSEHDFCCGTIIAFYPHISVKPALMHENRLTGLLKVALFFRIWHKVIHKHQIENN